MLTGGGYAQGIPPRDWRPVTYVERPTDYMPIRRPNIYFSGRGAHSEPRDKVPIQTSANPITPTSIYRNLIRRRMASSESPLITRPVRRGDGIYLGKTRRGAHRKSKSWLPGKRVRDTGPDPIILRNAGAMCAKCEQLLFGRRIIGACASHAVAEIDARCRPCEYVSGIRMRNVTCGIVARSISLTRGAVRAYCWRWHGGGGHLLRRRYNRPFLSSSVGS